MNAGLDTFFAQTERDSLCLVEVSLVDAISRQFLATNQGRYSVPRAGGVIELVPSNDVVEERVLRHELCHALDFTEGLQSTYEAELLDELPDGIEGVYEGDAVLWEAYSRVCEWGPRPPIDRWLESSCPGLSFGTPGERMDERTTWGATFPQPRHESIAVDWQQLELNAPIHTVWRAGNAVVLLESHADGPQLRWITDLQSPPPAVPLDADLSDVWLWPGPNEVLVLAGAPNAPHTRILRSGERKPLDLGEAYAWGPGVTHEGTAAGLLVDPASSVPLPHLLLPDGTLQIMDAPRAPTAQAGAQGIEWTGANTWVLGLGSDGFTQLHHGAVANGIDTELGRLFRIEATHGSTTQPMVALLTAEGELHTAGCEAVHGTPALLGSTPVVVRAEGSTLHVGVVSLATE